jgi:hypothetical protein
MTLGPALILMALIENVKAEWSMVVSVYRRVPFFYFILHFYLIHALLVIVFFASGYTTAEIADIQTPFFFRPLNFGYNLWIVYGIWMAIVSALYFPSLWFYRYKMQHSQWWLRYV